MSTPFARATPPRPHTVRRSPWWLLLIGPVTGSAVGVVARGWMRLLTDDPEFTWNGTVFIVLAFTLCGFGHSAAWAARTAGRRRHGTAARLAGAVLTLPLFVGAGAIMLPTVVAGSLARWRPDWPRWARAVAAILAVWPPLLVVVEALRERSNVRTLVGLLLFLATYAAVIASMRAVVAPDPDAPRMRRLTRVAVVAGLVLLLVAVMFFAVGVTTAD